MEQVYNRKWNKFLMDTEQGIESNIKLYVATFILTISKEIYDSTEITNLIRKISNVTTVTKRVIGLGNETSFRGIYDIKFVLEPHENIDIYLNKVLKRQLALIKGVRVNKFQGFEEIL